MRRIEFRWAVIAFAGVVLLGTLKGILVAVIASLVALAQQAYNPPVYALGRKRGTDVFRALSNEHPDDETWPGLLILRTEGRLFFANAQRVGDKMWPLIEQAKPSVVLLDCSAVFDIEYTALKMLIEGEEQAAPRGHRALAGGAQPGSAGGREALDARRDARPRADVLQRGSGGRAGTSSWRCKPAIEPNCIAERAADSEAHNEDGGRVMKSEARKAKAGKAKAAAKRPAPKEKLKRKDYDKELARLHVELVKLQEWVVHKGLKVCVVFEGRDGAGKGGTIKAITERVSPRVFRVVALARPDRSREEPDVRAALPAAPAGGRRGGDLRSQLVQPRGRRAGDGLLLGGGRRRSF